MSFTLKKQNYQEKSLIVRKMVFLSHYNLALRVRKKLEHQYFKYMILKNHTLPGVDTGYA